MPRHNHSLLLGLLAFSLPLTMNTSNAATSLVMPSRQGLAQAQNTMETPLQIAENFAGEHKNQAGLGDIKLQTGIGEHKAETGVGEIKLQTGIGEHKAETGVGEIKLQTGIGEHKAETGIGEIKLQTGIGEHKAQDGLDGIKGLTGVGEIKLQTGIGQIGDIKGVTGVGEIKLQTGVSGYNVKPMGLSPAMTGLPQLPNPAIQGNLMPAMTGPVDNKLHHASPGEAAGLNFGKTGGASPSMPTTGNQIQKVAPNQIQNNLAPASGKSLQTPPVQKNGAQGILIGL